MPRNMAFLALALSAGAFCVSQAPAQDSGSGLIRLKAELDEPRGLCIDIAGFRANIDVKVPLQAHTCKGNPNAREDELFRLDHPQAGNIHNAEYDVCLDAIAVLQRGSLFVRPCSDSPTQKFVLSDAGELRPAMGNDEHLCVVASPTPSHPAVRSGRTPQAGVTNVARAMSLAPCDAVADEFKHWFMSSSGAAEN